MTLGVILLILTGFCWIGIAAVVDDAARKRLDMDFIQFGASAVIALAAAGVMLFRPPLAGTFAEKLLICGCVFAAGACNFLMLSLMRRAMTFGSSGAVWGITQSAMVCPFAMGMVFFGVAPTLPRLGGIVLILTGIVLFSRSRGGRGAVSADVQRICGFRARTESCESAVVLDGDRDGERAAGVSGSARNDFPVLRECAVPPEETVAARDFASGSAAVDGSDSVAVFLFLPRLESGCGGGERFSRLSGCAGMQHCRIPCLGNPDAPGAVFPAFRRSRCSNLHRHFSACNLKNRKVR